MMRMQIIACSQSEGALAMRFLLSVVLIKLFLVIPASALASMSLGTGASEKPLHSASYIILAGGRVELVYKGLKIIKDAFVKGGGKKAVTPAGAASGKAAVKQNGLVNRRRYRNADGTMSKPLTPAQRKAALKRRSPKNRGILNDKKTAAVAGGVGATLYLSGKAVEGASEGVAKVITKKIIGEDTDTLTNKSSSKKK